MEISLELSERAEALIADKGYDPVYGARPLKRTIQRLIQDPLAVKILAGEFKEGDSVKVDTDGDELRRKAATSNRLFTDAVESNSTRLGAGTQRDSFAR